MTQGAAVHLGPSAGPQEPGRRRRRGWGAVTVLLTAGVFLEAVFAGAMLSGADWARAAHGVTAGVLVVSATVAGLVALGALRRVPRGLGLALALLGLGAGLLLQAAIGALTAKGANLAWLHIPLGVALFAFAALAAAGARRLGDS